jgi:hypothetical protein
MQISTTPSGHTAFHTRLRLEKIPFLALVDQPNGTRVDGRRMEILDLDADPAPRD